MASARWIHAFQASPVAILVSAHLLFAGSVSNPSQECFITSDCAGLFIVELVDPIAKTFALAVSTLHATIILSLPLGLAVVVMRRRPALAHAILFGASLSLIALPIAIIAFRDQAWQRVGGDSQVLSLQQSRTKINRGTRTATVAPELAIDLAKSNSTFANEIKVPHAHHIATLADSSDQTTGSDHATSTSPVEVNYAMQTALNDAQTEQSTTHAISNATYLSMFWQPLLTIVWIIGCTYAWLKLTLAFRHIVWVSRRSSPVDQKTLELADRLAKRFEVQPPRVIISKDVQQPMLWGVQLATIVLPESCVAWRENELTMVLSHEMAHIHRGDHWSKIVNQVVLALYWFHPLVHLQHRISESLAELSADDLSIARGARGIELSECLVKFASRERRSAIALPFASYRELRARIERLVSDQHANFRLGKFGRIVQFSLATIVPVALSVCIGLGEPYSAIAFQNREPQQLPQVTTPIDAAVASMAKTSAWSHLPLNLDQQIKQQILAGPEFNIQVQLVDQEKNPVPGTLCAIIENQNERVNRRPFSKASNIKLEALPLSLAVTDHQGRCFFEKVRGRHPSTNDNGIVQTLLVVLHPEYGFRVVPLKRSNRLQSVSLAMESGKTLSGDITDPDGEPIADVSIELGLTKRRDELFGSAQSIFGKTSIIAPIVSTNENGSYVVEGLPPNHLVTLIPSRFDYEIAHETNPISTPDISTSAGHMDITMRRTDKQAMRFQCVDSLGISTPPVPTTGVPPGRALDVDADSNFVTHAYETYGNGTRILRLNLPSPWLSLTAVRRQVDFQEPFQLSMMRGRSIRGKVVDVVSSQPIEGIPVFGREQIPKETLDERNQNAKPYQMWRTDTQTSERGDFELFISETAWSIMIDGPVYGYDLEEPTVQNPNEFFDVLAGNEPAPEIIFKLTPKKKIRGVVSGGDGTPIPNAEVACSYFSTDLNETFATTNAVGEFEIFPPPGKAKQYELRATTGTEQASMILPSDLAKDMPSSLVLQMEPKKEVRVIEGRILVDGEGKSGVEVAIGKGENSTLAFGAGIRTVQRGYAAHATTDSSGNYHIVVPESEHGQSAFHIISPPELATGFQTPYVDLDKKTNAGPKLEFITKPGNKKIRGKVLSVDDVPFEGATVYLSLANHNLKTVGAAKLEQRTIQTNENGEFEFSDLANTSYQLQAQSPTTNDLWKLVVRKICKAGDTDIVLIMDRQFLEPPEKIVPKTTKK